MAFLSPLDAEASSRRPTPRGGGFRRVGTPQRCLLLPLVAGCFWGDGRGQTERDQAAVDGGERASGPLRGDADGAEQSPRGWGGRW